MISEAPSQLEFFMALFAPLLRLEEAAWLMDDVSIGHVVALCEEGKLRAVDIANRSGAGLDCAEGREDRRCVRVYRYSVEWLMLGKVKRQRQPQHPGVESTFPHYRPTFLIREVSRFLNCSDQHVRNLAIEGPSYGATGSFKSLPRIPRAALKAFLESREINALAH